VTDRGRVDLLHDAAVRVLDVLADVRAYDVAAVFVSFGRGSGLTTGGGVGAGVLTAAPLATVVVAVGAGVPVAFVLAAGCGATGVVVVGIVAQQWPVSLSSEAQVNAEAPRNGSVPPGPVRATGSVLGSRHVEGCVALWFTAKLL